MHIVSNFPKSVYLLRVRVQNFSPFWSVLGAKSSKYRIDQLWELLLREIQHIRLDLAFQWWEIAAKGTVEILY